MQQQIYLIITNDVYLASNFKYSLACKRNNERNNKPIQWLMTRIIISSNYSVKSSIVVIPISEFK